MVGWIVNSAMGAVEASAAGCRLALREVAAGARRLEASFSVRFFLLLAEATSAVALRLVEDGGGIDEGDAGRARCVLAAFRLNVRRILSCNTKKVYTIDRSGYINGITKKLDRNRWCGHALSLFY